MKLRVPLALPFKRRKVIDPSNRHFILHPSMWCITPEQFSAFIDEVHVKYPDEDPTAYKVVEEMIKPMTREKEESYALMLNPNGVPVKHFITHAWGEGVKAFGASLQARELQGGLWICFLANPQTWPSDELDRLLGTNVWSSPFALAVAQAEDVVAVRNSNVNMYTRLWCVFELFVAHRLGKTVVPVGPRPRLTGRENLGFNAACSMERDTIKLRAAMQHCAHEINRWVSLTMRSQTFVMEDDRTSVHHTLAVAVTGQGGERPLGSPSPQEPGRLRRSWSAAPLFRGFLRGGSTCEGGRSAESVRTVTR